MHDHPDLTALLDRLTEIIKAAGIDGYVIYLVRQQEIRGRGAARTPAAQAVVDTIRDQVDLALRRPGER